MRDKSYNNHECDEYIKRKGNRDISSLAHAQRGDSEILRYCGQVNDAHHCPGDVVNASQPACGEFEHVPTEVSQHQSWEGRV